MRRHSLFLLLAVAACGSDTTKNPAADVGNPNAEVPDAADAAADASNSDSQNMADGSTGLAGLSLMQQMSGLWIGSASQTPLGAFPLMPMDFRAADGHVLFGRVDLDAGNALRMAFFVEELGGQSTLVFRNGGLFMGQSRDTKTALQSYDADTSTWHFCEPTQGCEYLDATISFADATSMVMDVKVRGGQHMLWDATRVEERSLPDPFPADMEPIGTGDAEFPTMPSLEIEVTWADPAPAGAGVWVILSDTECGLSGTGCNSSRSISATLEGGETAATLTMNQIHAADYHLNAVLDRDGNWSTSPFPQTGDAIVFPVDPIVTIDAQGTSTTTQRIGFDVP